MHSFTHNRQEYENRYLRGLLRMGASLFVLAFLVTAVLALPVLVKEVVAAPNPQMNYQGKLTNASGVAVPDGTYNMRFWLIDSGTAATSTALWTESLTGTERVQVTNGLFSVMLGSSSALTGVDFNQTLYLGVEVGGTGGSPAWDGEMSPRKVLGTVPAAFVATTAITASSANSLSGIASSSFLRSDEADTMTASSSSSLLALVQNGVGKVLSLFSGATEIFTALSNGNVGVGTSTPAAKFSVNGGALADFFRAASTTATSTFAGAVGIGSSTPSAMLTVAGTAAITGTSTLATTTISNLTLGSALGATSGGTGLSTIAQNQLLIGGPGNTWTQIATSALGLASTLSGGTTGFLARWTSDSTLSSGLFRDNGTVAGVNATSSSYTFNVQGSGGVNAFNVASSSGTSILAVTSNSRVGIGSTTPSHTLSVNGTAAVDNIIAASTTAVSTIRNRLDIGITALTHGNAGALNIRSLGSNTNIGLKNDSLGEASISFNTSLHGLALETHGDIPLSIRPNNVTSVYFAGNGNVAIGTSSAWAELSIQGAYGAVTKLFEVATTTTSQGATSSVFAILANGNVGVGTTSPAAKFSVSGLALADNFRAASTTATSTFMGAVGFGTSSPVSNFVVTSNNAIFQNTSNGTSFRVNDSTGSYILAVDTSGSLVSVGGGLSVSGQVSGDTASFTNNVGIGSSTPSHKLTVVGNSYIGGNLRLTGALLDSTAATGTLGMVLQTTGTSTRWVATSSLGLASALSGGTNGFLARWTSDSTLSSGLFRDNGTVAGVNATSSSYTFNVQGTSGVNPFNVSSSTGTSLFTIINNGNVGIGTTTPAAKLTVVNSGTGTAFAVASSSGKNLFRVRDTGFVDISLAGNPVPNFSSLLNVATDASGDIVNWGFNLNSSGDIFGSLGVNAGDSTTYLRYANSDLKFLTGLGSTEVMRLTSAGNLGIGTTSPTHKLGVEGTASFDNIVVASTTGIATIANRLDIGPATTVSNPNTLNLLGALPGITLDSTTLGEAQILYNSAYGLSLETPSTRNISIRPNNTTAATFLSNGNVGIGTSTPYAKLTVAGGLGLTGAFLDSTSATGTLGMVLQTTGTSTRWVATSTLGLSGITGSGTSGRLTKFTGTGAVGNSVLYEANSSIGLNVAPTFTGAIEAGGDYDSILDGSITIYNPNGGAGAAASLNLYNNAGRIGSLMAIGHGNTWDSNLHRNRIYLNSETAEGMTIQAEHASGAISFYTGASANERLYIAASGNIGVGTTSPWAKLAVQNSYGNTAALFDIATTTSAAYATSSLFKVLASGNVGIGNTSPSYKLHVGPAYSSSLSETQAMFSRSGGSAISVVNTAASVEAFLLANTSLVEIGSMSDTPIIFSVGNDSKAIITTAGNFGIGTSTPYAKLTVSGGLGLTGAFLDSTAATGTLGMVLQTTGTSTRWVATSTLGISAGASTFLALTDTPSSYTANHVLFTNSGATAVTDSANFVFDGTNLGIGTTSPAARLGVNGLALADYFRAASTTATSSFDGNAVFTKAAALFGFGTSTPVSQFTINGNRSNSTDNSSLTTGSETFGIYNNNTRLFAIGTTLGGDAMVEVAGADGVLVTKRVLGAGGDLNLVPGGSSNAVNIRDSNNSTPNAQFLSNGRISFGTTSSSVASLFLQSKASMNPFAIASSTGVSLLTLTQAGDLGIGTTSPAAKLGVNGIVLADRFIAASTTATSTFANGIQLLGGCFRDANATSTCIGRGQSATYVVAASNSKNKIYADYIADGTGDQVEINAAIAAAYTASRGAGGKVYLLEGDYSVSSSTYMATGTQLIGSGPGTILKLANSTNAAVNMISIVGQTGLRMSGVTISDLTIDGNRANQASGGQVGIQGTYVATSTIQRVAIRNTRSSGIMFDYSNSITIDSNTLENVSIDTQYYIGIELYSDNSSYPSYGHSVTNNKLVNAGGANGYSVLLYNTNTSVVSGNVLVVDGAVNIESGIEVHTTSIGDYSYGNTISNNSITGYPNNGISLYDESSTYTVHNNTISNNTIADSKIGIYLISYASNNTITGNTIYATADSGIVLNASDDNLIGNNVITDNGGTGTQDAIVIANSDRNLISSNRIDTVVNQAIEIDSSSLNNTLVGNYYTNTAATAVNDAGLGTRYTQWDRLTLDTRPFGSVGYSLLSIYASSSIALASTTQMGTGKILSLNNSAGEMFTVANGGNVGIGTSTPYAKLTVSGGLGLTGAFLDSTSATGTLGMVLQSTGTSTRWVATSTLGIASALSGGTEGFLARWTSASALGSGLFRDNGTVAGVNATSSSYTFNVQGTSGVNPFNVSSSTGTSLFTIRNDGNVGIGTTSPAAKFSVNGLALADYFRAASTTAISSFAGAVGIGTSSARYPLEVWRNASNESAKFNGTVGIGYSVFSEPSGNSNIPLKVSGEFSQLSEFASQDLDYSSTIRLKQGYDDTAILEAVAETQDFALSTGIGHLLLLPVAGKNVAIGTSSPWAKLSIQNNYAATTALLDIATTTSASNATSSLFRVLANGNVGIGTTSPFARGLTIDKTGLNGTTTAGIGQYLAFANTSAGAQQFGDNTYIRTTNTATTTLVGSILRLEDSTTYGNTVRGFEVQTERGTNTLGENTAISGFARTFGVRGVTEGDAGGTYEPAGVYGETRGTTQGNAIRGYSSTITTAALLKLFQDTSTFTGTGLLMNFGNSGGSFSSTTASRFIDLQNAGTSRFSVGAYGMLTIGNGTSNNAGIQIGYGGLCVDNDGSCNASTTGRITSVSSATGNSDLAEMYFSNDDLEPGEVVYLKGGLSVGRASESTKDLVIGVVSTLPGLLMGQDDVSLRPGEEAHPIALKGRVPVKVSNENGDVKTGDELMLSNVPGVVMKASSTGTVVGIALEDYEDSRAYSETFINQFGESIIVPDYTPIDRVSDPRINDGCYFGGGSEAGEAPCVPLRATTTSAQYDEADALALAEAKERALRALARQSSEVAITAGGDEVRVGQIVMFVDLRYRYLDADGEAMLAALGAQIGEEETDTIWSRLVELAHNFVDGVLSVLTLKADRVETNELCVDGVCVTADDLRTLLEGSGETPTEPEPEEEGEEVLPDTDGDTPPSGEEVEGTQGEGEEIPAEEGSEEGEVLEEETVSEEVPTEEITEEETAEPEVTEEPTVPEEPEPEVTEEVVPPSEETNP